MKKIVWILFAFFAIGVGLYPAVYFIADRTFGLLGTKQEALLTDMVWNIALYAHIVPGGLALMIGWIQFHRSFRDRYRPVHRMVGRIYVSAVMISAVAGIYLSFFATGGGWTSLGFFLLGVVWLGSTASAFVFIKKGDRVRHEMMMIYSYAACCAAITLRIWLPLLTGYFGEFQPAYDIVAWLCWVPNIGIAWIIVRRQSRRAHRISAVAEG